MELQWNQTQCAFLRQSLWQSQNSEQTLEVRLPEGMPDVGRILCVWGQSVLRSKQWRSDGVSISGGISVRVMYAPEGDSEPRCIEAWLPFQMKWNLSDSRREGVMRVSCCLRAADARVLSARKLLVRASVGVLLQTLEPDRVGIFHEETPPEGVELLKQQFPVQLPVEAGEKVFSWEEQLEVPEGPVKELLCCQIYPAVTEQTVTGSRVVFRGQCDIQLVYLTEYGRVLRHVTQVPFAQYAQLERDYEGNVQADVILAAASVEPSLTERSIRLQCELVGQYVILEQQLVEVIADAYSPSRQVQPEMQLLRLTTLLDQSRECLTARLLPEEANVVDVTFLPDQPVQYREEQGLQSQAGGCFQILYRDEDGQLQTALKPWSGVWDLAAAENCQIFVELRELSPVQQAGEAWETMLSLQATTFAEQSISMISGLEIGEITEPNPDRPALILRRAGEKTLWQLAKDNGSTVAAIQNANRLTAEPEPDQMLLIPVL